MYIKSIKNCKNHYKVKNHDLWVYLWNCRSPIVNIYKTGHLVRQKIRTNKCELGILLEIFWIKYYEIRLCFYYKHTDSNSVKTQC